jgi:sentrin-specific protease 7
MDSLGNASYKRQLSNPIREFLTYEWKEKKGSQISFKDKKQMRDFFPHVPNQTNSSDCGLFVLEYIEQFLSKPDYLVKKLFKDPKKALIDWFPVAEAKYKRLPIRNLILSLISPEMADKLKTLIKDDKESDDERDEIGMDCDFINDKDSDYVDKDSIEELSSDESNKHRTRSTTSKSMKICKTPPKDSNTIDLVESNEDICSQVSKSISYDSVVINDDEIGLSSSQSKRFFF